MCHSSPCAYTVVCVHSAKIYVDDLWISGFRDLGNCNLSVMEGENAARRPQQEYYYKQSSSAGEGGGKEMFERALSKVSERGQLFEVVICLCVLYFILRLLYNSLAFLLIIALLISIFMHLMQSFSERFEPSMQKKRRHPPPP